ncbi:hypothetical protein JHD48_02420 [Sulfurimonas sp. SAG-AH-194-I05]|nr:hypothetical protein [Sulfurimonas sp. SAG-AH-194-I05]MDF1874584.1 hypothetical protein [Sulfurimonas sp. SAG-AH-194-I05]
MSKTQKASFTSVISVNPYNKTYFNNTSNFLTENKSPEYSKTQYVTSYLNTQDYINNNFEISKNIADEDLLDTINIKVYDELGLDQAIEYRIQYIETFNHKEDENRHLQVFLVDPEKLEETYKDSLSSMKYIDIITPTPLLIKALYSKEIIRNKGAHCFIYFEENDAFLSIYDKQDFIYTKSLKYSFTSMHEIFCELYGEKVSYRDFITFLSKESLKHTTSEYKTYIFKLYKKIFQDIDSILNYAKKAFEIEKIEHLYVGSQINCKSKLYEIAEIELKVESYDFDFDYGFESNNIYVDQIHSLMHLNATLDDDEKYLCNFSSFHRPPKFIHRQSGKIIILTLISLIIAFIYPVSYWFLSYAQDIQYNLLQSEYSTVHNEKTIREKTIRAKEKEKKEFTVLLKEEELDYTSKKDTLMQIHEVKVNYPMKAKIITFLVQDFNTYAIKIEKIKYTETANKKVLTLHIITNKDKKITNLLEYLTKKYAQKFKFSLEQILYDEEKNMYLSELKVEIL